MAGIRQAGLEPDIAPSKSSAKALGFDIRGIRPPTTPARTARLRISLTANVAEDDERAMLDVLMEEMRSEAR